MNSSSIKAPLPMSFPLFRTATVYVHEVIEVLTGKTNFFCIQQMKSIKLYEKYKYLTQNYQCQRYNKQYHSDPLKNYITMRLQ